MVPRMNDLGISLIAGGIFLLIVAVLVALFDTYWPWGKL